MNVPNSSLYYKSGQLKVTLWKIVDFEYDRPITAEVRLPVWGGADGDPDTGRSMEVVPSNGVAELRIAFKFNYDSQKHIEFYLLEKEEELVSASWPLEKVLRDGKEELAIPFQPRGKLLVEMIWLDMPDHFPQWITVSKLWWQPATDTTFDLLRPRIEVDLGEEQYFTCIDGEERGGALHWPNRHFDRSYKGEEDLSVRLTDSTGVDYATTTIDLWGLLLADAKPCLEGEIRASKADGKIAGKLHIKLAFWDTPEEKERPAKHFDSLDTFAEEDKVKLGGVSDRSNSIASSSSGSVIPVQRVNSSEFNRALDDAKKAADAAEDDAAKAQEIAKMLTPDRIQGGPAKNAAREAEQAAQSARKGAEAVRALVDNLQSNRPQEAEALDAALRNVLDTARAVRKDKDNTADEAMNAVVLSARASARAAKDSALSAKSHSVDCQKVGAPHLNIKQCRELLEEVTHCAENADGEATTAHNCAEDAEDAYDYSEALQAASTAAKAAKKAREDELAAEDIYRKLLALSRKAGKYAERKAKEAVEKEEEMLRKAAEERERARKEEHEAEELRRRNRLLMDGDAAEQVVYGGARAFGFRQRHEDYEQTFGSPYEERSGNLCCGPTVSSRRSVHRHPSPTLLVSSVPLHELRGHDPHLQFEKVTEKDDDSGGICGLGGVLYGDDGLMEAYVYKRPSCWCFGCGCMRCCGEC